MPLTCRLAMLVTETHSNPNNPVTHYADSTKKKPIQGVAAVTLALKGDELCRPVFPGAQRVQFTGAAHGDD